MRWWRFSLGHDEVAMASLMARGRDEAMEHIFGPKRQRSDEARWEHISVAAGGPKRTFERAVGEAVVLGAEINKVQNELLGEQ